MNYNQILDIINQNIKRNEREEITGPVLNSVLRILLDFTNEGLINIRDVIQILSDSDANALGSINPLTNTEPLPDGVYHAQIAGKYDNAGGIVVKEGYYTLLRKKDSQWSLEAEVEMPNVSINGKIEVGQTTEGINGDTAIKYIQNKAIVPYDSAFASSVGYANRAIVYASNGKTYQSNKDGNKDALTSASWTEIILNIPTGEVKEGEKKAVSGGGVYSALKNYRKIDSWIAGTYTLGDQRIWKGNIWEVMVPSTNKEPGSEMGDEASWDWGNKTASDILIRTEGNNLLVITDVDGNVLFRINKSGYLRAKIEEDDIPVTGKVADGESKAISGDTAFKNLLGRQEINTPNVLAIEDASGNVLARIDKNGKFIAKYRNNSIDKSVINGLETVLASISKTISSFAEDTTSDITGKLIRFQDVSGNVLASIDKYGTFRVKKISASEIEGVTDSDSSPNSTITKLEEYTIPRYDFLTMKIVGKLPTDASPTRTPTNVVITLNNGVEDLITFGAKMSIQGSGSAGYFKKGYNINMVNANGHDFKLKIGDMIATDSFHVKAFHTDITHTRDVGNGRLWQQMYQTRSYPYNYVRPVLPPTEFVPLDKYNNKTMYTEDAKFFPDGIPCQITTGGEFFGLYTLRLKKTRENYALDRDNENHIFAENAITGRFLGLQHYETYEDWIEGWKLRTPKTATQTTKDNILRFFNWWEDVYKGEVSLADTHQDYIVLESWIDYYIIAELIGHRDISGNNTLINTYDGTHWQIFLYDTDNSIGIYSTLNPPSAGLSISVDIWTAVRTQLLPQIKDRYRFLREAGVFSNENFKKIYGGISENIPRSVYEQNYKKWGCQTPNGIPTMEQIYGFLNARLNTLDNLWINN